MKTRAVITVMSIALLVSGAAAVELEDVQEIDQQTLEDYRQEANQYSDRVPPFVEDLVGHKDVNVYIEDNSSTNHSFSLEVNRSEIKSVSNESVESPDIEVWTSTETIDDITSSNSTVEEAKTAVRQDNIRYRAHDPWTSIKLAVAESFMDFV